MKLTMFNSGNKAELRCNGSRTAISEMVVSNKSVCHKVEAKVDTKGVLNRESDNITNKLTIPDPNKIVQSAKSHNIDVPFTPGNEEQSTEEHVKSSNIKDLSVSNGLHTKISNVKCKNENNKITHHETLQRIEQAEIYSYYQQHWFSASLEMFKIEDRSREERIEITRHEFIRYIQQMRRGNVGYWNRLPPTSFKLKKLPQSTLINRHSFQQLVVPRLCELEECGETTLPCSQYCPLHIMLESRQVLFECCTAKFADNTQCSVPVFDICHELPLCAEHARKRDNYRLHQEAMPKKIRKKVKPSALIRPQKRSKKKKKPMIVQLSQRAASIELEEIPVSQTEIVIEHSDSPQMEQDFHIVNQALNLNENGIEQALGNQAQLLEETDINNVLNTIQVDEFSDFFTVNRNGEYEPSKEEAEELEKALAEVDNDVKSLERLSQSQGLLESLLDEHNLTETLVHIPEIFHNGYTQCGDSMVTQSSYLLPVEPHSHS